MIATKPALKRGFTLIELMVVVAIIGILMAAGILAFSNAQQNARDGKRRADINGISKALEQYYMNGAGVYPASTSAINSTTYFPTGAVPLDPQGGAYTVTHTTSTFCVCGLLEKAGRGNASSLGTGGACAYATGGNYFCASQRQ